MSEQEPRVIAILRAIEERLTALMDLQTDPEGRVQKAQTDVLYAYGLIAQSAEIMGIQRNQIMALSDAIAVLVSRFVEHDRRVATQHQAVLALLEEVAHGVGLAAIAQTAEAARAQLQAEADERAAELELSADHAKALLATASLDARTLINRALNQAEAELSEAAAAAKHEVNDAAEAARESLQQDTDP